MKFWIKFHLTPKILANPKNKIKIFMFNLLTFISISKISFDEIYQWKITIQLKN